MLNPFYWYSAAWLAQLILYSLGWSDWLIPIDTRLAVFVFISIIISAILGFRFKNEFHVYPLKENPHKSAWMTVAIIALFSLNFIYAGEAPLINRIFFGFNNYDSFKGIPTFAPFIYTLTAFYCIYLIFIFVKFPSWKMLLEILACMLMFCLLSSRSYLATFFAAFIVAFTETRIKNKRFALVCFIFLGILAVYALGILGNLRGGDWSDNTGIYSFSRINSKWPKWLPGQFAWGYGYITGTFNNLNFNVISNAFDRSLLLLICCFLPDFVVTRLPVDFVSNGKLIQEGFTTSGAYTPAYNYGGFAGMFLMFVAMTVVVLAVVWLNKKHNHPALKNAALMIAVYFMALSFYHEPFYYPGSFMMMFFAVLFSIICILKDRKRKV